MRRLEHRPVASRPQHVLGVQRDIIGGNLRRDVNESRKLLLRHERLELLELTLQQEQFTAGIRDEEVSESAIAARDELLAKVRAEEACQDPQRGWRGQEPDGEEDGDDLDDLIRR